jgi:hypothetical protein
MCVCVCVCVCVCNNVQADARSPLPSRRHLDEWLRSSAAIRPDEAGCVVKHKSIASVTLDDPLASTLQQKLVSGVVQQCMGV